CSSDLTFLPRRAGHLEERVGQRNGVHVLGQIRVKQEHDRHFAHLAGTERLLFETEALHLLEMESGQLRPEAGYSLPGDGAILLVADFVADRRQFAGMHRDETLLGLEVPGQMVRVRVEFDGDGTRVVDLGIHRLGVALDDAAKTGDLAYLLVEGHEQKAKAEHHAGDDKQLLHQSLVRIGSGLGRCAHDPSSQYLKMVPKKNVATILSRISAVLTFFDICGRTSMDCDQRDRKSVV